MECHGWRGGVGVLDVQWLYWSEEKNFAANKGVVMVFACHVSALYRYLGSAWGKRNVRGRPQLRGVKIKLMYKIIKQEGAWSLGGSRNERNTFRLSVVVVVRRLLSSIHCS